MANRKPHLVHSPVPVINVTAEAMPLPTALNQIVLAEESDSAKRLLSEMRRDKSPFFVMTVMSQSKMDNIPDRFYRVGVLCSAHADHDSPRVFLKGESRAKAVGFSRKDEAEDSYFVTTVQRLRDEDEDAYDETSYKQIRADLTKIKLLLRKLHHEAKNQWDFNAGIMEELLDNFENLDFGDRDAVDKFIWWTLASMPELLQEDKQPFLESGGLLERIGMMIELLKYQLEILARHKQLDNPTKQTTAETEGEKKESSEESQDMMFEDKDLHPEIKKLWKRFKAIRDFMTEDAQVVAREDLERLVSYKSPEGNSHEWTKFRRHVKFLLDLPWKEESESNPDIKQVTKVLDDDHYGLIHVKDRIREGIAPKILNPGGKGQILCFVGPSGVGKTSLAKSIAKALNRKLIRISLGGSRDEAQIRGHDVTYIGSQSGEILREMHRCGFRNPVFLVDEVDKIGKNSNMGDQSSAMLEVFDPEQNNSFRDHYLGCGFDLSKVMFIATANVEEMIQPALRDRMDTIRIPGYMDVEKMEIAKRYLIPRWMSEVGLTQKGVEVVFSEDIIFKLIHDYTSEAGVRTLEKIIASISRKLATRYLESQTEGNPISKFVVDEKMTVELLGPAKVFKDKARPTKVGEAIGLAWTEVGGSILYVQSVLYPNPVGKKAFARTGMQGEVMREADDVAMTLVRNRLREIDQGLSDEWRKNGIHLHIPEGAIPKDGPSAGITVFAALYSLATKRPLKPYIAMTGEIDLVSNVKRIGGVREKVVAAGRAGIKELIMPKENERDLYDVPVSVKENIKFHFVETLDEMIEVAF